MSVKKSNGHVNVDEDEGLLALRHYELEAYAATVTALRAEGGLTIEKKNVLKQLQTVFGISVERHKAEIRRAVNDEKLSSIATQIHGNPCELDWQIEGQRLFGVLNRPTPITAYTKLADEIASTMLKENKEISLPDEAPERREEPLVIHPPENPQKKLYNHVFEEVNNLINSMSDANEENKANDEDNGEVTKTDDVSDSYVYLPSGKIVQLEPKTEKSSNTTPDLDLSNPLPKKRRRSSSIQDQSSSFSIKQVYKPGEIQTSREQALPQQEKLFSPKKFKPLNRNNSPSITVPFSDRQPVDPKVSYESPRDVFPSVSGQYKKSVYQKYEKPSIPHTPVPPEHLYAAGSANRSFHSRPQTSWATKHNVTNEGRSKRRLQRPSPPLSSRKLNKSMPGSTRYNFSPSEKKARILSAKDTSSFQYQSGLIDQTQVRPRKPGVTSRVKSFPPFSSGQHPFPDGISSFAQASEQQQSALSPQRVFRPTLHISSSNTAKKKNPVLMSSDTMGAKKHPLSYPEAPLLSSSSHNLLHCSVESGLAPVSTIVSQVAAQAELSSSSNQQSIADQKSRLFSAIGKVKIVRSTCPKQPMQQVKSLTSMGSQRASDVSLTAYSDTQPKHLPHTGLSNTPPPLGPLRPSYDATREPKRVVQSIEPISPLMTPLPSVTSYTKSLKEKQGNGLQLTRSEQDASVKASVSSTALDSHASLKELAVNPVDDLPESISAAASGLCALASSPVVPSMTGPTKAVPNVKPSPVQISSASIIKVTPRPFSVPKSLPIVTRIAGTTRITKTLTSASGVTKPSIIVVHRQQGKKSITTAPAKFLEIEGPGKPGARGKTVASSRPAAKLPTTIIKPSSSKLFDASVSSRPMSGDPPPIPAGIHKVITKGKMRQLVLKPTSPSQSSQVLHPHVPDLSSSGIYYSTPLTKPPHGKESHSSLSLDSYHDKPDTAASLHATSTIKALMAIQKTIPSTLTSTHSVLSTACGYSKMGESATESTFSHLVASKPQLLSPRPSPNLKDPIVRRQQQRTAIISSKKLADHPNPDQARHRFIGDD